MSRISEVWDLPTPELFKISDIVLNSAFGNGK